MTHILFQVDNETEVDVYRAKGHNGKIYEVSPTILRPYSCLSLSVDIIEIQTLPDLKT